MKILWVCNVELPIVSVLRKKNINPTGGWLDETSKKLISDGNELLLLYKSQTKIEGENNNLHYIGFDLINNDVGKKIILFKPDIIHIWGTELVHSYDIINICKNNNLLDKVIISIQGLISIYGYHYYSNLPTKIIYGFSIRDIIRLDNVFFGKRNFLKRGVYERKTMEIVKNVIGRTRWDYACAKQINEKVNYYFCNEILRSPFYNGKWNINNCERHSIFFSQSYYPIKGFHIAIEAFKILLNKYKDLKIYVVGSNILKLPFYRITYYQKYLRNKIIKYNLQKNIIFCGQLSAEEMKKHYLKSNVFVSSSSIENSSNSVGEAMILGCPIVASDVGGIKDLLLDEKEGYIYPFDEPYMLAYYIDKIFSSDDLAMTLSQNAQSHARITHNIERNYYRLLEIYKKIIHNM